MGIANYRIASMTARGLFLAPSLNRVSMWILDIVVLCILLTMALLLPVRYLNMVGPYRFASYDFDLNWVDKQSLATFKQQGFFVKSFDTSALLTDISAGGKTTSSRIDFCDTYDNQDLYFFNESTLVSSLPQSEVESSENGISVDLNIAEELGLQVGDEVSVTYFDGAIPMKVVRIYEPVDMGIGYLALARSNAYFLRYWNNDGSSDSLALSDAFIKVNDVDAAENYLATKYEGPDSDLMDEQELKSFHEHRAQQGINVSRQTRIREGEQSILTSVPFIIAVSAMALVLLCIYVARSFKNVMNLCNDDYATLHFLGMTQGACAVSFLLGLALSWVLAVAIACIVTKCFLFGIVSSFHFSWVTCLAVFVIVTVFLLFDSIVLSLVYARIINARIMRPSSKSD